MELKREAASPGPRGVCCTPAQLFVVFLVALTALFAVPLVNLVSYSRTSDLYSHVVLVPFVSLYLYWLKRYRLPPVTSRFSLWSMLPAVMGLLLMVLHWTPGSRQTGLPDSLLFTVLAFVCFLVGGAAWIFGPARARALAFPLVFLVFMAPFPTAVTHGIEIFFQYTSAEAASLLFSISQTSVLRDGLFFKLPGIVIEVAQECSGIRSTLVLFITSLVAGYLFFDLKRYRAALTLAIVPIAILRNGFRIFTIAWLCIHVDPSMIDSVIHRRGGPIFFALSLIPLFVLVLFLYRRQKRLKAREGPPASIADPAANCGLSLSL